MIGTRIQWLLQGIDPGSGSYDISLHPTYSYSEKDLKSKSFVRSYSGRLHDFTLVGSYRQFTFPLGMVNSSDAYRMNYWWEQGSWGVKLTINGSAESYQTDVFTFETITKVPVRIRNVGKPFAQQVPNKYDYFMGILLLETI
jgi:hypothetical protein